MQKILEAVGLKPKPKEEVKDKTPEFRSLQGYDIQGNWLGYGDAPKPFHDNHVFEKDRWR